MRKGILFLLIVVLPGIYQGCTEDFFELTNPPEFPWLNVSEFERAAVSPYHYAFFSGWGGEFFMTDRVFRECLTDMVYRIPGASANFPIDVIYNRQTDIDDGRNQGSYRAAYNAIGLINTALDFYYEYDGDPFPEVSADEKKNQVDRIAGELHFMRAFSYLHQCYRHAPPPGTPGFSTEEILPFRISFTDAEAAANANFVTTDTIYARIIDDLERSLELLPEGYVEGVHHPSYAYGRANKYVAQALLSRVYFQTGQWQLAEEQLNAVIGSGRYDLDQDPIEAFNRSSNSRGNEVIWQSANYDVAHGQTVVPKDATLFTFLDYRAVNGGLGEYFRRSTWHTYSMGNEIAKEVGWMDENLEITPAALRDKRYTQLFYRLEGNRGIIDDDPQVFEQQYTQVKEPRIWGNKYYRGPDGMHTNVPVIRLAECYLTRSIIRFRGGNLSGAADDLNVVRARAWEEQVAGVPYASSDQYVTAENITEEMIHLERVRELAFEGDRLPYLQALQLPVPPGDRIDTPAVEFPYRGLYWTIPQKELDFKLEE